MALKILRYVFIVLLQIDSLFVFSQNESFRFEHLDTDAGLSNNRVTYMYKDPKGFMWFATQSGLNRYDGSNFRIFKNDGRDSTSLSDNSIIRIFELPDGKLGIFTESRQLNIYDPVTEKFDRKYRSYFLAWQLPEGEIRHVMKDVRGNYWFLYTTKGLYKYDPDTRKAFQIQLTPPASNNSTGPLISAFSPDSKGNIWILYRNGYLEKLNIQSRSVYRNTFLQKLNKNKVDLYQLYIDAQDELWISAFDYGVFYFNPLTQSFVHFNERSSKYRLNSNSITMTTQGIVQDDEGKIWIATDQGGVNLVDKKDLSIQYLVQERENNSSISQNAVLCLYKDNNSIVWAGTYKQGVNSYNKSRSKFSLIKSYVHNPNSLPYEDVNRFAEDSKGNLWIGTNGGGLIYFDRTQNKFTRFVNNPADPNSLGGNIIVSLWMDIKGHLWIGTYLDGIDCYDGKKFTHYRHKPGIPETVAENNVWEIFQDSRQNLWVGTIGNGLDRFNFGQKIFHHYRNGKPNAPGSQSNSLYVSSITEDKNANLLIGTSSGLEIFNIQTGRFTYYSLPLGPINNFILDIKEDSRGLIWIATRNGLNLFDPVKKTFRVFRKQDGLPDDIVLTILEDNNQNLWMSTPNGLCNMIIKQHNPDSISVNFKNYDKADGLQGREFNENAAFKTRNGELVFGGPSGINIFKPDRITVDKSRPDIVLTDFRIFNKSVKPGEIVNDHVILQKAIPETKSITLNYNENFFSIEFEALDFVRVKKQRFEYILEGFNKDWIVTNNTRENKATYTNLDPGEYYFKIKTVDSDGIASKVLSLQITIIPPFWMTWWFRILLLAFIIGAVFIFYTIRMDIIRKQKEKLEIKIQERTESLAQAIKKEHESLLEAEKTNNELEGKNKELEQFAFVASHDLQEPLRTSSNYVELMQRQYAGKLDEKANLYLTFIKQSSDRMKVLITDLLNYSRIGSKKELEQIDCNLLFNEVVEDLALSINESGAEIVICPLPLLNGYRTELKLLFQNLITNALKFTKKGTLPLIKISLLEKEGYWQFSFKDNGIGIEEKHSQRIFLIFQRLHTRTEFEGSGIGLSHCKKIAELHNGKIWVESVPMSGSTFHFTISRKLVKL